MEITNANCYYRDNEKFGMLKSQISVQKYILNKTKLSVELTVKIKQVKGMTGTLKTQILIIKTNKKNMHLNIKKTQNST